MSRCWRPVHWHFGRKEPGSPARLMAMPMIALPIALLAYHGENLHRLPLLPFISISITLGMLSLVEALKRRHKADTHR